MSSLWRYWEALHECRLRSKRAVRVGEVVPAEKIGELRLVVFGDLGVQ